MNPNPDIPGDELCPITYMPATIPPNHAISGFITGDGNCGFRALSHELFDGDQEQHYAVRLASCLALVEHQESFNLMNPQGFDSSGLNNQAHQTLEEYLEHKRLSAESARDNDRWADEIMIQGVALAYGRSINVYSRFPDGNFVLSHFRPINALPGLEPITIVHQNANHFEVLIPSQNQEEQVFVSEELY